MVIMGLKSGSGGAGPRRGPMLRGRAFVGNSRLRRIVIDRRVRACYIGRVGTPPPRGAKAAKDDP